MPRQRVSLWGRVVVGSSEECWPYEGPRNDDGYGIVGQQGKAHRLAYEDRTGPIPVGLSVLHHCDNPPCCNPAHLFLGTIAENNRDRQAKGRSKGLFPAGDDHPARLRSGERHWCARLSDADVRNIRERSARGTTNVQLGREFNVNPATISRIARGIWRAA